MISNSHFDLAIIGGGIVGLATAFALTGVRPDLRLVLLEKEKSVASHQTGHNSGVVHSGIYYRPGSLKARLCVEGARRMIAFCEEQGLPIERCGKLIVASSEAELPRLDALFSRAQLNEVPGVVRLRREQIQEIEPKAAGLAGLYSPATAIVDYRQVTSKLETILLARGVEVRTSTRLVAVREVAGGLALETTQGEVLSKSLVNCAGLYSDVIARMTGARISSHILPFRGEYYLLRPSSRHLVKSLIYPVPDPAFPFLGVHFTCTVQGEVEIGPNAVLALAREGYSRWNINLEDISSTLAFRGFWQIAFRYWKMGSFEYYRSFRRLAFVRSAQRLVPDLGLEDVVPGGSGVRAQAVSEKGDLLDDFNLLEMPNSLHVLNAPSPAATASFSIGDYIAARALRLVS